MGEWADDPVALDGRIATVAGQVRRVSHDILAPVARQIDREHRFPREGYQALAAAGLTGLTFPESLGGTGDGTLAYAVAMEQIASACGSTSLVYMTQMHCAYPISLVGTQAQQEKYIPGLIRGDLYGSLAVTEPDAGSDVSGMKTRAVRDGDEYLLSGTKTFITTGDRADVVIVFARTSPGPASTGITAFILERGTPGFGAGSAMGKLGMRGSSTAELHFDDCHLPVSRRLGGEGEGYGLALQAVTKSRISAAAQGLGLAVGAYDAVLRLGRSKGWFGPERSKTQDLQFTLADMRTRIAAARTLLHAAAQLIDEAEGDHTAVVGMAKLFCTDLAMEVTSKAVDLAGEDGDLADLGLERFLRDAKVTQIYDGTNQIQRMLISRDIRHRVETRT